MAQPKVYHRPYPEPEPRCFAQWCNDLGISCEGACPDNDTILTFDEFYSLADVRLTKVKDTELYGFWRQYGDVWGESRTVQEWLNDLNWEIVDPTEEELKDRNLILGHDEFRDWSSGKVTDKEKEDKGLLNTIKKLFTRD